MPLTSFSVVGLFPVELFAAVVVLYILARFCAGIVAAVQRCLSPALERRARKRAHQPGDVTTDLSTAPGELDP